VTRLDDWPVVSMHLPVNGQQELPPAIRLLIFRQREQPASRRQTASKKMILQQDRK
jgi:hypothetical protein